MTSEQTTGDGLNAPVIAVVGVVSAILTFAIIIGVQVLYYKVADRDLARKDADPFAEVRAVLHEQEAQLAGDSAQARGVVPITTAMKLVVSELRTQAAPVTPDNPASEKPNKVEPKPEAKTPPEKKSAEEPGTVTIDLDPKKE